MSFELLLGEALILLLICSALPLLCCSGAGLLISLLQALTQINEQSIAYVARFFALCAVLWCCAGWLAPRILGFFEESLAALAALGRMP